MAKRKARLHETDVLDTVVLAFSLLYMQSILTVAHHISLWKHDGTGKSVERPATIFLVLGLLFMAYLWRKRSMKLSILLIISLTIFATSFIFWLSGLRTNFYF